MKDAWSVIAGVFVGLFFALLWQRNPIAQIKRELKTEEAALNAKIALADAGANKAIEQIEAKYKQSIKEFDDEQKKKLVALRADPVALAVWLTRLSG